MATLYMYSTKDMANQRPFLCHISHMLIFYQVEANIRLGLAVLANNISIEHLLTAGCVSSTSCRKAESVINQCLEFAEAHFS